jgi:hypothetical protein
MPGEKWGEYSTHDDKNGIESKLKKKGTGRKII